jgi:hypothetical protein
VSVWCAVRGWAEWWGSVARAPLYWQQALRRGVQRAVHTPLCIAPARVQCWPANVACVLSVSRTAPAMALLCVQVTFRQLPGIVDPAYDDHGLMDLRGSSTGSRGDADPAGCGGHGEHDAGLARSAERLQHRHSLAAARGGRPHAVEMGCCRCVCAHDSGSGVLHRAVQRTGRADVRACTTRTSPRMLPPTRDAGRAHAGATAGRMTAAAGERWAPTAHSFVWCRRAQHSCSWAQC